MDEILTQKQIKDLNQKGFKEGDFVPGRGTLTPAGSFKEPGAKELETAGIREGDFAPGFGVLTPEGTFRPQTAGEAGADLGTIQQRIDQAKASAEDIKRKAEEITTTQAVPEAAGLNLQALTREQATGLFGTDFTGVTIQPDGTFRADPTAIKRISEPGFVASSAAAVQDERATVEAIRGAAAEKPSLTNLEAASADISNLLEAESERLEKIREEKIATINAEFIEAKAGTEAAQKREKGAFAVTLQNIGGFLGGSVSSVGAMRNLASEHKSEIASLKGKRDAAIAAAESAIDEKQFKIAKLKADEVKSLEEEIEERTNNFFDQTLDIIKENRLQEERSTQALQKLRDDARQSLNTIISNFGGIDIDNLDEATREQLIDLSNIAEMPLSLLTGPTLKQEAAEATETQRQISNAISAANLQIRQDSFNLSVEKFEETEKLSALEAQRLGLPRTLVGVPETQVEEELQSTSVPEWFVELDSEDDVPSANAEELSTKWNSFRNEILSTNPLIDFSGIGIAPVGDPTK